MFRATPLRVQATGSVPYTRRSITGDGGRRARCQRRQRVAVGAWAVVVSLLADTRWNEATERLGHVVAQTTGTAH